MAADKKNTHALVTAWHQGSVWLYLLWPMSLLYRFLMLLRRWCYRVGIFKSYQAPMPVIVIGNISVGGTGKTPMVIALIKALNDAGLKPAVISRGYGSKAPYYPYCVSPDDAANITGDEPLLIAQSCRCPVIIGADRKASIGLLIKQHNCDVVVTDDGLQHYALKRDLEIAIVDGDRLFGNGHCLPMGPLREPITRLQSVDWVISNGVTAQYTHHMQLTARELVQLKTGEQCLAERWQANKKVHAVAGIGNPSRFFNTLRELGFDPVEHAFADHHHFVRSDIVFDDNLAVVMTAKDAVKIKPFATDSCWFLPVDAHLPSALMLEVINKISGLVAAQKNKSR